MGRIPYRFESMIVKSYRGKDSKETVIYSPDYSSIVRGSDVILVEDVLDTGRSSTKVIDKVMSWEPASIVYATLCNKPSQRIDPRVDELPRYEGFTLDDNWILGQGFDTSSQGRGIQYLCVVSKR